MDPSIPCRRSSIPTRSLRDSRVDRCARRADRDRRPGTRDVPVAPPAPARANAPRAAAAGARNAVREYDPARGAAALPGKPRHGVAHLGAGALERARDGGARQPRERRAGRAHRELRLGGRPVRGGLQPFLPRRRRRRSRLFPAALRTRRLRARVPRGPPHRENLDNYRRETGGKGLSYSIRGSCPTSGSSPRLHGTWAALRDLPGARFMRLSASGLRETRAARCGLRGRRRMDEPSRSRLSIAARETLDNLVLVVNCNRSASTARARQRLDHPGAREALRGRGGT